MTGLGPYLLAAIVGGLVWQWGRYLDEAARRRARRTERNRENMRTVSDLFIFTPCGPDCEWADCDCWGADDE